MDLLQINFTTYVKGKKLKEIKIIVINFHILKITLKSTVI